jgi:hypothetical protein
MEIKKLTTIFISVIFMVMILSSCQTYTLNNKISDNNPNAASSTVIEKTTLFSTPILLNPKEYQTLDPNGNVKLVWECNSDKDLEYDLYFGEKELSLVASKLKSFSYTIPTEPHKSYIWKVAARYGNSAKSSKIGHFNVKCRGW